ncbi:hypothetical protein HPB47_009103, partial [Ixodes persulcatus]
EASVASTLPAAGPSPIRGHASPAGRRPLQSPRENRSQRGTRFALGRWRSRCLDEFVQTARPFKLPRGHAVDVARVPACFVLDFAGCLALGVDGHPRRPGPELRTSGVGAIPARHSLRHEQERLLQRAREWIPLACGAAVHLRESGPGAADVRRPAAQSDCRQRARGPQTALRRRTESSVPYGRRAEPASRATQQSLRGQAQDAASGLSRDRGPRRENHGAHHPDGGHADDSSRSRSHTR